MRSTVSLKNGPGIQSMTCRRETPLSCCLLGALGDGRSPEQNDCPRPPDCPMTDRQICPLNKPLNASTVTHL